MDSGSKSKDDGRSEPPLPTGMVELRTFSDLALAELTKSSLEAGGIECWLTADDCGGMIPGMDTVRGVKLSVRSSDLDAASALLAQDTNYAQTTPGDSASEPAPAKASSPRPMPSLLQLAAGVIAGVLLCLLYQWTSKFGTKTYRYDTNRDGKTDEVSVYRNGYPIEHSYDRNFDGRLDEWYHYDSGYKRLLSKADDNFDGTPDLTRRYADGLLVSCTADTDFNGTPDVTHTFKDELVVQSDWRPNGTNIVTLRQVYRHEVLIEELRDTNMDGSFDVTIRYDAFQNVIQTNAFMLLSPASR